MPRKKRSASPFELLDDDYDEDASSQSSRTDNPPIQRNAANARERARMRVLSSAFGRLKTKLPNIPSDTKLSKLDTLRLATMYIKQLKAVVEGNAPLSTNAALGGDHDNDGSLNDTPSCYLQLHSGSPNMNWPFGLHHQVSSHHSSTRSSTVSNGNANSTTSWCQTEASGANKQSRYETETYQQHPQSNQDSLIALASLGGQHHHHQENTNSYLLTLSTTPPSSSLLTTPPNPAQQHETMWYSETPSPDLSSSTTSSAGGVGGYDSSHVTPPHQQRHNNLMEHLSHMQLTPPTTHSSSSASRQQFQHQPHHHLLHPHPHHHNPNNPTHYSSHHLQHHMEINHHNHSHQHHHHHLTTPALHHQNFANSQNLTSASIR